jgi:hypothetical protein
VAGKGATFGVGCARLSMKMKSPYIELRSTPVE